MLIGTIVGHNANLPMGYVKSLIQVKDYPYVLHEGCSIPMNRNAVFERARIEKQDLLFIDSDMVFKPEDVKRMEELLKTRDVVSGVCVMSFEGNPPAIFKKMNDSYHSVGGVVFEMKDHIFEVDACGAAFLGISLNVINKLTEPFEQMKDEKWGTKFGEDISFCIRAKEAGFKVWCDPSLQIGHIKTETKYYANKTRPN